MTYKKPRVKQTLPIEYGDTLPPQNLEMEIAVLGAILSQGKYIDKIMSDFNPSLFYNTNNREICTAIIDLYKLNTPIDLMTLVNQLTIRGSLNRVGGYGYVMEITSKVSSTANIDYYIRILQQEALKRKHSYVVQTTVLLLPTTKPNGEDIFPDIENYIQKFSADTGDLGLSNLLATMYDTVDDLTVSTYFKNWTHIGQEYTCIPWRDQQDHPYVRHYYHNKPWTMHESDWPDLKPWFDEARRICEKYIDARQFFKFLTPTNSTEHQDNIGIRKSGPTHISKQKYLMNNLLIRLKDVTNN
jgi:hypothetical protein